MAAPTVSTCTAWATAADVCNTDCADTDDVLLAAKLQVASNLLFHWSGRQFAGDCNATVRPCSRYNGSPLGAPSAWGLDGGWGYGYGIRRWQSSWGFCSCNRTTRSGCSSIPEITLGGYPVVSIDHVLIDGDTLDPSAYRVDDYRWLVRVDGDGWPCCQNMELPTTEEGTWEVAFHYGVAPPPEGVAAAAALACQLALACTPGADCALDPRVSAVTRQGVSEVLLIGANYLENVKVAVPEVGAFLQAHNPKGITARAAVASPDIGRRVRRAGTWVAGS